jgi:hypothetical protein
MVVMVIAFNIALSILCLGIAWKLHQFKRSLRRTTRWLTRAQHNTNVVLLSAPHQILLGQSGAQYGRRQVAGLTTLQQHIVRLAALLQLLQWICGRPIQPIRPISKRLTTLTKPH